MIDADLQTLIAQMRDGKRRALARLISQIENQTEAADAILKHIYPYTGHAYIIGITGAPGTGKSCLVNALTQYLRHENHTVGIIAVDPTSPFSGGAVLGDRYRMQDLAGDSGVFIRSMASRGNLGGLARTTYDVIKILDAAHFDYILIETVGAGQNEVDIVKTAHTTLVIDAPGLGDDIQAIKAGILEIADILVVNKADRPGVKNTVRALQAMLDLGHRHKVISHHGQMMVQKDRSGNVEYDFWQVPILQTIATDNNGIAELYEAIQQHRAYLVESGNHKDKEVLYAQTELFQRIQQALMERFFNTHSETALEVIVRQIAQRELDPISAVNQLLES